MATIGRSSGSEASVQAKIVWSPARTASTSPAIRAAGAMTTGGAAERASVSSFCHTIVLAAFSPLSRSLRSVLSPGRVFPPGSRLACALPLLPRVTARPGRHEREPDPVGQRNDLPTFDRARDLGREPSHRSVGAEGRGDQVRVRAAVGLLRPDRDRAPGRRDDVDPDDVVARARQLGRVAASATVVRRSPRRRALRRDRSGTSRPRRTPPGPRRWGGRRASSRRSRREPRPAPRSGCRRAPRAARPRRAAPPRSRGRCTPP